MTEQQETLLNEETWNQEAEAAINDIRKHVKSAGISRKLSNSDQRIFINLTTLENTRFCIEMSANGFRIVGKAHDDMTMSDLEMTSYETPYALLNVISKKYRESFGGELMSKLMDLAKNEKKNM